MDIDLDFSDRGKALELFPHIVASRVENGKLVKHNTGVYLHGVPVHAPSGLCAIPYSDPESAKYFKIDFLNVGVYAGVGSEEHLVRLMNAEPLWELLEQDEFTDMLYHINGHGDILRKMRPKSVEQLAAVMAMIRPAKRYLIGKSWDIVDREVWEKPTDDSYYWKKSHAFAYAFSVIVQMNLICETINSEEV